MLNETNPKQEGKLWTPPFRVSFPQVFAPRAASVGQEPKYSIAMLFPKVFTPEYAAMFGVSVEECNRLFTAMKNAVGQAATGKWGADKTKWPKGLQSPWHDGSEKDYDGYDDKIIYASASSKLKPGLADSKLNPIIEPNEFYGGCWARATVVAYAYPKDNDPMKKKGVSFGLRNIQKLRDGEVFGGGAGKPEDDFAPIEASAGETAAATAGAGTSELGI